MKISILFNVHNVNNVFGQKSTLQQLIKSIHENYNPFQCSECQETFGQKKPYTLL
jgi:hypothetical protein